MATANMRIVRPYDLYKTKVIAELPKICPCARLLAFLVSLAITFIREDKNVFKKRQTVRTYVCTVHRSRRRVIGLLSPAEERFYCTNLYHSCLLFYYNGKASRDVIVP
jgi:hypothetical protein